MKTTRTLSQDLLEGNFLSVDLETTGLDPRNDAIIEVGIVRMTDGDISDTYNQLIDPGFPIPSTISQITGIHTEDCRKQPAVEAVLPEVLAMIKDQWIVAHNADFDFEFLQQVRRKTLPDIEPLKRSRILDTLTLSRLLMPWLPNHRLGTISEALELKIKPEHRALADAETTALVFREFINRATALSLGQIDIIDILLNGAKDGLRLFFQEVRSFIEQHGSRHYPADSLPDNIIGKMGTPAVSNKSGRVKDEVVEAFFRKEGPLHENLEQYECRMPQIHMAVAIGQTLNRGEFLLAEAGTGVGKSMAYLAPAVLWGFENPDKRQVISTHTKTLQDQLFKKELPLLQQIYPGRFTAVLLKGRSNYLCLRRYTHLLTQLSDRLSYAQRIRLLPLIVWADLTLTGDIEENAGFHRDANNALWSQVNCEPGQCLATQCAFYGDCYLQRIRKASRGAGVVVINHALLFSSLTQSHSILGEFDTLIVDEAHQVERVAANHLGIVLSMGVFWETVHWLYQSKPEEVGILVVLKHYLSARQSRIASHEEINREIDILIQLVSTVLQEAQHFFQRLNAFVEDRMRLNGSQTRIRLRHASELQQVEGIVMGQMIQAVNVLSENLERLVALLMPFNLSDTSELENLEHELSAVFERLRHLQTSLNHFQEADYTEYIVWCEKQIYHENQNVILHSVPLDIARILANTLYSQLERCVMTSATLTVGETFDYILNRLGMNLIDSEQVRTQIFGSPFHYPEQALFLMPAFLPYPKADSYTYRVGAFIQSVVRTHAKGTLILFTSHKMLKEVYAYIQPDLEAQGIEVLGQGISGSRSALLKSFIEKEQSVLLGTASFWEGIDVPGKSLEMLVITRIPFDVPTEPVIEARMEEAEKRFGSGFFHYAVPEAVVKFRQGFGRLIRTASDRGVVLLLDQRAVKSKYAPLFLKSLPVDPVLCHSEEELMQHLKIWFDA